MAGFDHDTALRPDGDGAYAGSIGETWWTPRGPLGGYVMAILLRGKMSVYLSAPLPLDDGLLLGRFDTRLVRDGFFDESGELWDSRGTLVAQSRQLGCCSGPEPPCYLPRLRAVPNARSHQGALTPKPRS